MALTPSEADLIYELEHRLQRRESDDRKFYDYYSLQRRIEQLGMAVPPDMRKFLVVANWPRVVVRTIAGRQRVRALILPDEETADPHLRAIWDANNLTAQTRMFRRDALICGRAFLSVGTNEKNPDLPIVRVESPRQMEAMVDSRRQEMTAAARFYDSGKTTQPRLATLYLPDKTIWLERETQGAKWTELRRDVHNQGAVPILMHLNERISGDFEGESELTDIIALTDATARSLTNLQFAQEAHGIPRMWMTGVAKGDFTDSSGQTIPMFEAYFDAIHTLSKTDAKIGQLTAADLKNFETAMNIYGKQAALSYGFPGRYFGITSANPPAEGAIRADEIELINHVEDKNEAEGMVLGWMGALALKFATGNDIEGNRVRVDYFDPGTPTYAQRADALTKLRSVGGISREGMWDEMGWSEARKAKERQYLADEADESMDPYLARLTLKDSADADAESAADGA